MLRKLFLVGISGAGLAGCALPPTKSDNIAAPPPALMKVPGLAKSGDRRTGAKDIRGNKASRPLLRVVGTPSVITLALAYRFMLQRSPELAGTYMTVRTEEARILQAGLVPNPEVEVELEEFGGTRGRRGFGSSEVRIVFSQVIETGGKRARRVSAARRRKHVASWAYLVKRANLFKDAAEALIDVVTSQQLSAVRADDLRLANRLLQVTSARVNAGQLSPVELNQARVRLSTSRIAYRRARSALVIAKTRLAAFWGAQHTRFRTASLAGVTNERVGPLATYLRVARQNPEFKKRRAEILLARAVLRLQQARNIPNVTVGAGTTRFIESRENALIVKLSVPLPIFGLNQGEIAAARFSLRRMELDLRALSVKLNAAIRESYRKIGTASAEMGELNRGALPAARRAVAAAISGFREGKFNFLAVLDAQRSLLDLRLRRVRARQQYWKARVGLARLIGRTVLQRAN